MILKCDSEFRGYSVKTNDKGSYFYISIESAEEDGEAVKFPSVKFDDKYISNFKKGDLVSVYIDYNVQYKSMKIVEIEKKVK